MMVRQSSYRHSSGGGGGGGGAAIAVHLDLVAIAAETLYSPVHYTGSQSDIASAHRQWNAPERNHCREQLAEFALHSRHGRS